MYHNVENTYVVCERLEIYIIDRSLREKEVWENRCKRADTQDARYLRYQRLKKAIVTCCRML